MNVFQTWYDTDKLPETEAPAIAPGQPVALDRVLRVHSTGEDVAALQQRLQELGFAIEIDGVFGLQTRDAVAEFQAARGLQADGIVGPVTVAALAV